MLINREKNTMERIRRENEIAAILATFDPDARITTNNAAKADVSTAATFDPDRRVQ